MLVIEEHVVLHKLNSAVKLISENNHGGSSMTTMNYIGLDVHKKTISYCVKDVSGRIQQEGKIGSTRRELDGWMKTLPQPWTVAMEATIFSGWIYDHLLPHATQIKVAAARDCCGREEERPDRCQQARRLPEMRLPPGVPHDASSDTGSKAHAEVPASAGAADGAEEEPCLRTADGNRRGVQQATAAQGELLPGTALRERGGSSEPTAAVEAQTGAGSALS